MGANLEDKNGYFCSRCGLKVGDITRLYCPRLRGRAEPDCQQHLDQLICDNCVYWSGRKPSPREPVIFFLSIGAAILGGILAGPWGAIIGAIIGGILGGFIESHLRCIVGWHRYEKTFLSDWIDESGKKPVWVEEKICQFCGLKRTTRSWLRASLLGGLIIIEQPNLERRCKWRITRKEPLLHSKVVINDREYPKGRK